MQEIREQYECWRTATDMCPTTRLADCPADLREPVGLPEFANCAGNRVEGVACCAAGLLCTEKNRFYAQCRPPGFTRPGWTLAILDCE